jgi:hypothetical protein
MSNQSRIPRTSPAATRPNMPKSYGILDEAAGSGLLPWSRVSERLEASRNYWVHTTCPDGRPHVKPVWGIWFEERFYFATSPKSVTGQNISVNSSLSVNLESGDDVVILEGTAEVVTDPALLSQLDEVYFSKYSYHVVQEDGGPVYTLRHKVVFAWLERDFTGSATKYRFHP